MTTTREQDRWCGTSTKDYEYTLLTNLQMEAEAELDLNVYVDSDWAGCKTTRKSTSGGVIYVLGVAVHHYSRTQQTIATSSGEAELYAIGSGVCEGLGIANMLTESGLIKSAKIFCHTDSTCAKTIATRMGTSKTRSTLTSDNYSFKISQLED